MGFASFIAMKLRPIGRHRYHLASYPRIESGLSSELFRWARLLNATVKMRP